jgi:2-deoxy-D-gluconate 3-dehydrogenase
MSLFDLTGKKALVTGGSRGIGRGLAEALLEAGAEVVISGVSERVFVTAEELTAATGSKAVPIRADLAERAEIDRLFAESLEKLGTVDIVVANHGIQRRHPAHEFPAETMDEVIDVNLKSVFLLNQLAARHMLAKGYGRIINIASMMSYAGGLFVPAYTASKGGIAQMVKSFSNEWAKHGVTVNAIAPGYIITDMTEALINNPERYIPILERIPAGRWGTPDDLKGVMVFLASDAASFVSGITIPVDGGWLSR